MICPKCNEGTIETIFFKKTQKKGYLCDYCGSVWLEPHLVRMTDGLRIQSLTKDDDFEYSFTDADYEADDDKPVMYPKFK